MKIVFQKSEWLGDWYVIDAEDHAPVECHACGQTVDGGMYFDASVEGRAAEMREIARAIRQRGAYDARRCAVRFISHSQCFALWSPRNSQRDGRISMEQADDLASQIEAMLGKEEAS